MQFCSGCMTMSFSEGMLMLVGLPQDAQQCGQQSQRRCGGFASLAEGGNAVKASRVFRLMIPWIFKNDKFIESGSTMICINQYHPLWKKICVRQKGTPGAFVHVGVSKNRGTPKWMVIIMENPIKMDDLGVPHFRKPPHTLRKINMEPENIPLEFRKIIFQTIIFRFYVNLRGGVSNIPISTTHIKYTNIKGTFQLYLSNRYPKYMHLYLFAYQHLVS